MLQTRTVEPRTLGLLKRLMAMPEVDSFYLVGGTALALQLGHRVSVDLDLFTLIPFEKDRLLAAFESPEFDLTVELDSDTMLFVYLQDVKVDFVKMSYPILFPTLLIEGVRMLDIQDIAPMKLKAVTQRGSKKDFFDIYYLLEHGLSLEKMLELFQNKFSQQTAFHAIKSLTYFEDAEGQSDPIVFDKTVTWKKVKTTIQKSVNALI